MNTSLSHTHNTCIFYVMYNVCSLQLYRTVLAYADDLQGGLGQLWHMSELPRPPLSESRQIHQPDKTLVVVPMGDDVDGAGRYQHPGNGLVEGEVLVEQTSDRTRRALGGGGVVRG